MGATISRIARRSKCSPALVYKLHRSKEDLVLSAFTEFVAGRQLSASLMANVLDEDFFASILIAEASPVESNVDAISPWRRFSPPGIATPWARNSRRAHPGSVRTNRLAEGEDDQNQRLDYALRTVIATVLSVSWLATVTASTDSLDMTVFAEPLRCGLQNQWFPDTG